MKKTKVKDSAMYRFSLPLLMFLILLSPSWADGKPDGVELELLRPGVYLVRDYMSTQDYGRVDCNGLLYIVGDEALVIDTPHTEALAEELIARIKDDFKAKIVGVVIGHTHVDSMGGLAAFTKHGIPSYASLETQNLARKQGLPIPLAGYDDRLELLVGGRQVRCQYFGPGHTLDNSVTYLEDEKVLFGDCLVKALGASKGYLGDSLVDKWSDTVTKVRAAFPLAELVVPGHAKAGGRELLDYTIDLFRS